MDIKRFWFSRSFPMRVRIGLVYGLLAMLMFGALGRVYAISVNKHDHYEGIAARNATTHIPIPAERGKIIDCNGEILAHTIFSGTSVFINARQVPASDRYRVATELAEALGLDVNQVYEKLVRHENNAGLPVKMLVSDDDSRAIKLAMDAGRLPGVHFRDRVQRLYPKGSAGGQVVGFANLMGEGGGGIELAYDGVLAGTPGYVKMRIDARRRGVPTDGDEYVAPVDGANVHVTLNATVQGFAEEALREMVDDWAPESACAVVMESKTGRILAISNYPSFDPNEFQKATFEAMKNRALTDGWEPGSIFKPLILAGGIEDGLFTPDTLIPYKSTVFVKSRRIPDDHPITGEFLRGGCAPAWVGLMKSSNTCALYVGESIYAGRRYPGWEYDPAFVQPFEGAGRFDGKLKAFGFGDYTGIDIGGKAGGESRGRIPGAAEWANRPNAIRNVIPSIAMGYQVQVTAVQMLACFNAIAIDGVRMRPYVVEKVVGPNGNIIREQKPEIAGHSGFSAETAQQMRVMLERVVSGEGTAKSAALRDYRLAGKTGTAKLTGKLENGKIGYLPNAYMCSFVGFAPADNPVLSCIVVARHPSKKKINQWGYPLNYYGGNVAAPAFAQIVGKSLKHLGVEPSAPHEDSALAQPRR